MIIFLALVLIIAVSWSLFNPFVAMITLMGVNFVNPGDLYHVFAALHVERLVALIALVTLFARGHRFLYPKITRWVLYFYGACVASVPFAFWVSNSLSSVIDFGKTIVIHLCYVALVNTRERMRIVLLAFTCMIGYLCVTSLNLYFHGVFQHTMGVDRITGLAGEATSADALGLTIVTAIPIVYLFAGKSSGARVRLIAFLILLLSLWTLSLSGTRGPVLTFVLITVLAAAVHRRRALLLPSLALLLAVAWIVLPAQYKARYASVNDLKKDESYQDRLLSWEGGWHMFLHNPVTGIGIGNYTYANGAKYWPEPRKVYLNAHSIYFKCLGELGLLGVISFTGFVGTIFVTNNRIRRRLRALDQRARAGPSPAPPAPEWLLRFPTACTLSVIGLLYCGYAYHDLYRPTWYFLAAASGAADLITQRELQECEAAEADATAHPTLGDQPTPGLSKPARRSG
ncbi:MAG TPA: O-antigen ligase family protein [Terriglobales bacterium]